MREKIKDVLEGISPSDIEDEAIRETIYGLINLVETVARENRKLREENQKLRDEIKKLKGSNPRPDISGDSGGTNKNSDRSSDKERPEPDNGEGTDQQEEAESVQVDREEILEVDEEKLPDDAEFKGYEERIVQEIVIETDNVLYRREKYYSPSEGNTYVADLPEGVKGGYGPVLQTFAITLTYACNVTVENLREVLSYIGVVISKGGLINLLTTGWDGFHEEREGIRESAKRATRNQVFDHTGMKVNGENTHCGILATGFSTVYQVTETKSRHDVIRAMCGIRDPTYRMDEVAITHLEKLSISSSLVEKLRDFACEENFGEEEFEEYIGRDISDVGPQQLRWIKEAGLWSWVQYEDRLKMDRMICDDAREFMYLLPRGLCWIHEARHYKELTPLSPQFQTLVKEFLEEFWELYGKLLEFKQNPTSGQAAEIEEEFDEIFSRETGYDQLDNRIKRTKSKKEQLLRVLADPTIPLHNNAAELGARQLVVKRNISQGTRSERGTRCWESFLSILETAKKLGVNFFDYIEDRIKGTGQFSTLPEQIKQQTKTPSSDFSFQLSC